jgi:hypothetical protein
MNGRPEPAAKFGVTEHIDDAEQEVPSLPAAKRFAGQTVIRIAAVLALILALTVPWIALLIWLGVVAIFGRT